MYLLPIETGFSGFSERTVYKSVELLCKKSHGFRYALSTSPSCVHRKLRSNSAGRSAALNCFTNFRCSAYFSGRQGTRTLNAVDPFKGLQHILTCGENILIDLFIQGISKK